VTPRMSPSGLHVAAPGARAPPAATGEIARFTRTLPVTPDGSGETARFADLAWARRTRSPYSSRYTNLRSRRTQVAISASSTSPAAHDPKKRASTKSARISIVSSALGGELAALGGPPDNGPVGRLSGPGTEDGI